VSTLEKSKSDKKSGFLGTSDQVITRFNVPSNVVTREAQLLDIELREPILDMEMSKRRSLTTRFSSIGM
jgi:hypothetical protein